MDRNTHTQPHALCHSCLW